MMSLLTHNTPDLLWHDLVRYAENRCAVNLKKELEAYLVTLLMRYMNKPEVAKQVFAHAFLEAMSYQRNQREVSLQHVGDQCLLFAGLFPHAAQKKYVNITYFVEMGRTAYSTISHQTNDLYDSLALQFVVLMDVLQSISPHQTLLPLEAYDQWYELGSQRALKILREYSKFIV